MKNIIFDFGNVLVHWEPYKIIQKFFPNDQPKEIFKKMYEVWIDLNLGKLKEEEAIKLYQQQLNVEEVILKDLMHELKTSQTPIPGSIELLKRLSESKEVELYAITDNIREFIKYHEINSEFIKYFQNKVVVSADVGLLKPSREIYEYLLKTYNLDPSKSIFIDDVARNVEGAKAVGIESFQFIDMPSCEQQLIALGVKFDSEYQ